MKSQTPSLEFFDCNTWIGRPMNLPGGHAGPTDFSADSLLKAMDRAGIARALVWHVAQRDAYPDVGNELLIQAIAGREGPPAAINRGGDPCWGVPNPDESGLGALVPCWTILPPQSGEQGSVAQFFARAKKAGVKALRVFPDANRYLLRRETMAEVLEPMIAAKMPLIVRVPGNVSWEHLYNLLADFPRLRVIMTGMGAWGTDRYFRPLLAKYPHVYVETSGYITDGGIEALVADYGAGRMVFGSDYPEAYQGAMMLALAHAEIPQKDKQAIAGGNLNRLLAEVRP